MEISPNANKLQACFTCSNEEKAVILFYLQDQNPGYISKKLDPLSFNIATT
uniref:Uncharacterized protein n=1 Tax=Arundo donax TaxID=35708 RepID=A0A0A9CV10_ARUDO